ncbi:hypothetical protein MMIC_P2209 [Mariprofundus micogutta]|uniref:Glycine zipper domain-containing protein n=1 Tax=Mariprofundus micogutta TaxID=1921010 RepID=A0A1L8CQQ8_9PROT|nr:glycine zipper domain-containing protein [Mariprofundus micogutta]GAV21227.1 hypothetical protein MMIC_P2209 [Mariprofundus micogutta]
MKRYVFIAVTLVLTGCATAHQERTATQGAVVGATAGAVIGAQSDQIVEGAIIGGVLGGLAGAILADDRDDRIHASEVRYHRRSCRRGDVYFGKARHARNLGMRVSLMRQGIAYCPDNPAAHNDLGMALMLWGDSAGARAHFNHALRLDPHYYPSRHNLSRMSRYHAPRHRVHQRRDMRDEDDRYSHEYDQYRNNSNDDRKRRDIRREQRQQELNEHRKNRRERLLQHEERRQNYIESREKWEEEHDD